MEEANMNHREDVIREPWFAVFLSQLLPGMGQIYGGKTLRGIFSLLVMLSTGLTLLISVAVFCV
jgi:TM2 domain-containing membrane protein YozV